MISNKAMPQQNNKKAYILFKCFGSLSLSQSSEVSFGVIYAEISKHAGE